MVVGEDGFRPTCELRVVTAGMAGFVGVQQKWVSSDSLQEEWRYLPSVDYKQALKEKSASSG